jgi:type IV pilus assembly protein PilC
MPLASLSMFCRSLGTMLESGVPLLKALSVIGKQQRSEKARRILENVHDELRKGSDIATALREHGTYFPELLVDMVNVAEQTGSLPEVLAGLASHYENLERVKRMFLGAIAWPVIQLVAAVFIIAGMILVLGWVSQSQPGEGGFDPLGFGLKGEMGALLWLTYCFGSAFAMGVIYFLLVRGFRQASFVHGLLLQIPIVGHCMRSFSIARFSWAYALTQQAGMDIKPSLEASFKATGNGAFAAASPQVVAMVMAGEEFVDAVAATGLFPRQFIEMVRVGESSGTVPETLQRLSPQFEDEARRSLAALTMLLGGLVWAMVAGMIIFLIFRLAMFYVNRINNAANGVL